jgi:hypothetical protein
MSLTHETPTMPPPVMTAVMPANGEARDALAAAARDRASRNLLGLTALLQHRPDLRGVHAPADFAADAVRWSA